MIDNMGIFGFWCLLKKTELVKDSGNSLEKI